MGNGPSFSATAPLPKTNPRLDKSICAWILEVALRQHAITGGKAFSKAIDNVPAS
jgi:hypothetical protein